MSRNLNVMSAVLISATLLFALPSVGLGGFAFGQMQQQEPSMNNRTIMAQTTPEVEPINQTEAEEILDNLYEAREEIMFGEELQALKHLDNIENIVTGQDVILNILVTLANSTETATATNNDTESMQDDNTSTEEQPQNEEQDQDDVIGSFGEPLPSTSQSELAQIVPIQQNMNTTQNQDTRTFRVTFDSIEINQDHDPVYEGEWLMDVYVNEHRVPLFPGSISVGSGDTYTFDQNNEVTVTVPADTGHIWITTAGWENDVGFEPLPDLTPSVSTEDNEPFDDEAFDDDGFDDNIAELDTGIFVNTFAEYTRSIQSEIAEDTAGLSNDPQGVVKKAFYTGQDFEGQHSDCSEPNEFAVDNIKMWYEQDCDFVLNWSIEEVQ